MKEQCCVRIIPICIFMAFISLAQGHEMYKRQIIFPGDRGPSRSTCRTPDRREGQCIRITECPSLLRLNNFNQLRQFFCGYQGEEPKVCCPRGSENPNPTITTRQPGITRRPNRTPTPRIRTNRPVSTTTARPRIPENPRSSAPDFLPRDCGMSSTPKRRIVGGSETEKGAYPWMALILKETRRGVMSPDCGAALVTNMHVVTAAHCVIERGVEVDPGKLSVRVGDHHLYRSDDGMNPVEVPVESIHAHEDFEQATFKNDIAVLTLSRPIVFTRNITPICLPYGSLRNEDLTGRSGFVSGWGTTSFMGPSSDVLMEVSIPIVDQRECRRIFASDLRISQEYLCAGMMDGSKDSCQGDSGGPLVLPGSGSRFYLIGVVSFGRRCAEVGYPGVYTRVTEYLDWLTQALS